MGKQSAGKKQDAAGSAKRTSMKQGDRIPKKAKKGEGESPKEAQNNKLCQNCAKWAPAIKNTHNTGNCRKFNSDGTRKGAARNVNMHGHDDDMMAFFRTMKKDQKAIMKKFAKMDMKKKSKGSARKSSYDSSDDDSSDSD